MQRNIKRRIIPEHISLRHPITRRFLAVTISIACLAALATGLTFSIRSSHANTTASSAAAAAPHSMRYTLITGERVIVTRTAGGTPMVSLGGGGVSPDGGGGGGGCPGGGGAAGAQSINVVTSGSHLYVLPDYAAGYIGQPLSVDLFDVNAMAPDTSATSASAPIPLTVDYTSGSPQHLPPGLSGKRDGSITVANRTQFGQAIAQASHTDETGGTSQLFAGIARIAPAGTTSSSTAYTPLPGELFTVTVKAFDRTGRPAGDATAYITNVNDDRRYFGIGSFFHGSISFSVPAGQYNVVSAIRTFNPDTNSHDITLAVVAEVNVTRDVTVVTEARKGQLLSVTAPQPATLLNKQVTYQRDDQQGGGFALTVATLCAIPDVPYYATPTAPVSVGKLSFMAAYHLVTSLDDPATSTYDLTFPYAGSIPSNLAEAVTQGQLATIHARYHSPIPGRLQTAGWAPSIVGQFGSVVVERALVAPLVRTEYVIARPDVYWGQFITTDAVSGNGAISEPFASYAPGQEVQADWMAQPMASGIRQEPALGQVCPMCRNGDTLNTVLSPFTDNHGGTLFPFPDEFTSTQHLTLYQNGTQVGESPSGIASFPMSPDPAHYRLVFDASQNAAYWPTSTHVHTEWSFSSQERAPDQLPPGWTCAGSGAPSQCSFEPLLFTQYATSAGLDDVIPGSAQATIDVRVSHQRGAADAPITHFSAQVSYDDGQTWQSVPATDQGNGVFRLQYTQPDLKTTNGFAALRIQATDDAGSAIDQTITRAYPLAVTPLARLPLQANRGNQPACSAPSVAPYKQCMALVNTDAGISLGQPQGLSPADIQSAYNLSSIAGTAGQGRTVAIVDAFDNPNAEADLAFYRTHYGLPPCTSANGCFTKVNQRGETSNLPFPDPGWGLEISLDLDAVSATCPSCKILLVEADSPFGPDLDAAVQMADKLGATVLSNSYGTAGEFSGEQYQERSYRNLHAPFVVSSGDYGYGNRSTGFGFVGPAFPAASQFAIAVGGTTLKRSNTPRGWTESAWAGATSGCSAYIHKPGWQKDNLCSMRTVADVAAVADPETGLAVYDTFFFHGWLQVGGTSLAAPIISAVYAMAGDGSTVRYASNLYSHAGTSDLNDVTGGSNASSTQCVNANYLCTSVPGYDGPTGLGTPNGMNAFH